MTSPDSRGGELGLHLLMGGEGSGGHQCLDRLPLSASHPSLCNPLRQEHGFTVLCLFPQMAAQCFSLREEKDAIPQFLHLFQGTAQLSQNPFALFLKQWERHSMGSLGSGISLGPTSVAGEGAGTIKALGAPCDLWGLSAQKMGAFGLAGQVSHTLSATKEEDFQSQGSGAVFTTPNNHTRLTTGFRAAGESWQLAGKGR